MRQTALVLVTLAAVLLSGCSSRQTVEPVRADIVVARSGKADYQSIQVALNAAEDGSMILVKPGVYREAILFPSKVKNVMLIGSGPGRSVIDAGGNYAAVKFLGEGHGISGFTIRGGSSHGVYVPAGRHHVQRCLITGNGDRGIYLSTMSGDGRATIDHCTIVDNEVSGIYDANEGPGTKVTSCIIARNGRGISFDGKKDETIVVSYSCLNNRDTNNDDFDGAGNITSDPKFVNPAKGDYRLKAGSPCKGTGADGSDMGCF